MQMVASKNLSQCLDQTARKGLDSAAFRYQLRNPNVNLFELASSVTRLPHGLLVQQDARPKGRPNVFQSSNWGKPIRKTRGSTKTVIPPASALANTSMICSIPPAKETR